LSSRALLFFMVPEECERLTCEIAARLGLWVVLEKFQRENIIEVKRGASTLRFDDDTSAERVWFSEHQPPVGLRDVLLALPATLGWVMLYPSRIENDVLVMADRGAKSDWLDIDQGRMYENPRSIKLFQKIARRLRRHLPFVARNRWTGDVDWHSARVRHSVGVAEWVFKGGKINQSGVVNVDYTIDESAEEMKIASHHA